MGPVVKHRVTLVSKSGLDTGNDVASDDFGFKSPANATKKQLSDLDTDELPKIFSVGGPK